MDSLTVFLITISSVIILFSFVAYYVGYHTGKVYGREEVMTQWANKLFRKQEVASEQSVDSHGSPSCFNFCGDAKHDATLDIYLPGMGQNKTESNEDDCETCCLRKLDEALMQVEHAYCDKLDDVQIGRAHV